MKLTKSMDRASGMLIGPISKHYYEGHCLMKRASILLLSLALATAWTDSASAAHSTTDLYWIDVNGGGATLIVTPSGESILIDSGENKALHASRISTVMTQVAGLKQIDHFIISHWHADHYGGSYELTKLVPIKSYYANSSTPPDSVPDDSAFPVLMPPYRRANHGPTLELAAGSIIHLKQVSGLPSVSLRCLVSSRHANRSLAECHR